MTAPIDVDRAAPVIAFHEIDIEAPLDTVWRLHTDVNAWPTWQTEIAAAHIDGALEPGVSFDWTSYGFSVTSTVYDLAERSRVIWGGTSGGITGIHEWLFSETPGGVHVTTTESFSGEPVQADAPGMQTTPTRPSWRGLAISKWLLSPRPDKHFAVDCSRDIPAYWRSPRSSRVEAR